MKVLCKEAHKGKAQRLIQVLIPLQEQSESPAWTSLSSYDGYHCFFSQCYCACRQDGVEGTHSDIRLKFLRNRWQGKEGLQKYRFLSFLHWGEGCRSCRQARLFLRGSCSVAFLVCFLGDGRLEGKRGSQPRGDPVMVYLLARLCEQRLDSVFKSVHSSKIWASVECTGLVIPEYS